MSFNPDPTKPAEEIIFSRKRNKREHPPLFYNNVMVKRVQQHKHLGLVLDSCLTFAAHITEKIAKARKGIGVIKYLSSYIPVGTLEQIYKTYVRPHLDFCDIIYHSPEVESLFDSSFHLSYWMNQIEKVRYQAALAVTGTWQGTNTDKIYEELGWESLSKRRWFRRLIQIHKIQNNLCPHYLKEALPTLQTYNISTRRGVTILELNTKRDYFKNSFYPDAINSWNNLDINLRIEKSLNKFKTIIIKIIRP